MASSLILCCGYFSVALVDVSIQIFRPWARFWIAPIVQLIVSGGTGSPGIHYFVVDMVVTILSWHTVAIPEVK